MISSLTGKVSSIEPTGLEIEVSGVGYFVNTTSSVLAKVKQGTQLRLVTHMVVREDAMTLYGFETADAREVFRVLLSVTGVGPKLALALLSAFEPGSLRKVVAAGDVEALRSVPGVGKRGAERLVLELKEKLGFVGEISASDFDGSMTGEVREALLSLGYTPAEVREAMDRLPANGYGAKAATAGNESEDTVEHLVRAALRELARK